MTSQESLEHAWAAGLFDGKGTVMLKAGSARIQVASTDRSVIERFHKAVGVGTVYGPYKGAKLPIHLWIARGKKAETAMVLLYGMVSDKRKQRIEEVFGWRRKTMLTRTG